MSWEPAGHRILVLIEEQPDRIGAIYIPPVAVERRAIENVEGIVVSIGMNAWKAFDDGQQWCKVGDRISFAKYAGSELNIKKDNKVYKYRYLNDEDVVGIWRDDT